MKKARVLISSVFVLSALAAGITAAGCHKHTFSDEYGSDNSTHWNLATCKHSDVKNNEEAHTLDEDLNCTVCGWHHQHVYEGEWETNGDAHFRKDACGHGTTESYPHEASAATNWTCTECGYVLKNSGIAITLPAYEYTLPENKTTMDIPTTDMKVNLVKSNGAYADEVASYSKKYYKGDVQISTLNGVGEGSYNIWATATVDGESTETFVVVYVFDELLELEFKEGLKTQEAGSNIMAGTWKFNAKYRSGKVEELTVADLDLDGLDTSKITEDGKATVKYTAVDIKGRKTTKECTVDYTVTEATGPQIEYTKFSADSFGSEEKGVSTDKVLIEGALTLKANATQTIDITGNKKSYTDAINPTNNRSYEWRIQLKGTGNTTGRSIEVKTEGKAKIVVFGHTNTAGANRQLVLAKPTFVSWATTPEEIIGEPQLIGGDKTDLYRVEYDIEEAGTYYLVSTSGGINIYGVEIGVEVEGSGSSSQGKNVIVGSEQLVAGTSITAKTEIATGVSVIPAAEGETAVAIDENGKSYAEDNKSFSTRLKLGGTGDTTKKSVELVISGKAKVVVYAMSSSSGEDRPLALSDGTTELGTQTCLGKSLTKAEYTVETAGTYYLFSKDKGINVYGIEIIYE